MSRTCFLAQTVEAMRRAFEEVCGTLQLTVAHDPPRVLVANQIVELVIAGEHDARRIASRVIAGFPRH
jgi:hypothetical protein